MKPLSLLVLAIVLISSCSKPANTNNTNTNANYTDTSTNYLKCQVNGNYWHSSPDSVSAIWSNHRKKMVISGYCRYGNDLEIINININNGDTIATGSNGLNDQNNFAYYYNIFAPNADSASYCTDSNHIGGIYMSIDLGAGRVSGNFSISCKDKKSNVSVALTSGTFSMPYKTTD